MSVTMGRTKARVLLATILLLPGMALANAGKILFVRGEVAIVDDSGDRVTADAGTVVEEGDRIRTGDDSRAQLRLSDGALISLRSRSDYQILAQNTEEGLMEQAGKLFSGWMRTVTGAIGEENPEAIEQETPVATIGIRGTTYQAIHMPKGGIPGIPESEPGTYIYLQQGRIETTAGGETRFMEPGDVVFVPVGGGVPVPAPDKKSLFSRGEGRAVSTDSGDLLETPGSEEREDLESTDSLNDSLDQQFPPFNDVLAVGSFVYSNDFGTQLQRMRSDRTTMKISGAGSRRAVTEMAYTDSGGYTYRLQANTSSASPQDTGYHVLPSGGEINWGVWRSGDYSEEIVNPLTGSSDTTNPTEDWHYMMANEVLGLDEVQTLVGRYQYSFVGGPSLSGTQSGSTAITGGQIDARFLDGQMTVSLSTAVQNYNGGGSFAQFYDSGQGIDLFGSVAAANDGNIQGAFVDKNNNGVPSGIISEVRLGEDNTTQDYHGTAAFENQGPVTGN